MQTVLITGANGFVGNYLCERLARNFKVVATGRGDCRLSFSAPVLKYRQLDISSEHEVRELLQSLSPDFIVHAAAITKPDDCELNRELTEAVNVGGTRHLCNHAGGAHFIYLSTDFVFSGEAGPYREEDVPAPVNYYGETKLLAENLVRTALRPWTIVRTVLVYGPPRAGRGNLLTMVRDALTAGRPLRIFTDQWRTPTYVEDLVWGIEKILLQRARGIFHLSGEDGRSPYEMAVETAHHLRLDESLISPVTEREFHQPARRPPKTGFDISKAKRELGFRPTSFEEGLRRTFALEVVTSAAK